MKLRLAKKIVTCKSTLYRHRPSVVKARQRLDGLTGWLFLPLP